MCTIFLNNFNNIDKTNCLKWVHYYNSFGELYNQHSKLITSEFLQCDLNLESNDFISLIKNELVSNGLTATRTGPLYRTPEIINSINNYFTLPRYYILI